MKKYIKRLQSFLICITVLFSASACADKTPEVQDPSPTPPIEQPVDPTPSKPTPSDPSDNQEAKDLEEATEKLADFLAKLESGKNFTYDDGDQKFEFDGNKVKITIGGNEQNSQYLEKDGNTLYNYSKNDQGKWQKSPETELDIDGMIEEILDTKVEWNKYENGTLYGTTSYIIPVTAKLENNTLAITISDKEITIDYVNETTVTLPQIEAEEEFKVEEHIDELLTNLQPFLQRLGGLGCTINETYNIYLKKGESGIIDTIGAVQNITPRNAVTSTSLVFSEMTINTQEDLTYQSICKNGLDSSLVTTPSPIFNKNISPSKQETYKDGINILFDTLFGENARNGIVFSGWLAGRDIPGYDRHEIFLLKNNVISYVALDISNNGGLLTDYAKIIEQNFKGKPEGDPLQTWKTFETKTYTIPDDAINIWKLLQEQSIEEN